MVLWLVHSTFYSTNRLCSYSHPSSKVVADFLIDLFFYFHYFYFFPCFLCHLKINQNNYYIDILKIFGSSLKSSLRYLYGNVKKNAEIWVFISITLILKDHLDTRKYVFLLTRALFCGLLQLFPVFCFDHFSDVFEDFLELDFDPAVDLFTWPFCTCFNNWGQAS